MVVVCFDDFRPTHRLMLAVSARERDRGQIVFLDSGDDAHHKISETRVSDDGFPNPSIQPSQLAHVHGRVDVRVKLTRVKMHLAGGRVVLPKSPCKNAEVPILLFFGPCTARWDLRNRPPFHRPELVFVVLVNQQAPRCWLSLLPLPHPLCRNLKCIVLVRPGIF